MRNAGRALARLASGLRATTCGTAPDVLFKAAAAPGPAGQARAADTAPLLDTRGTAGEDTSVTRSHRGHTHSPSVLTTTHTLEARRPVRVVSIPIPRRHASAGRGSGRFKPRLGIPRAGSRHASSPLCARARTQAKPPTRRRPGRGGPERQGRGGQGSAPPACTGGELSAPPPLSSPGCTVPGSISMCKVCTCANRHPGKPPPGQRGQRPARTPDTQHSPRTEAQSHGTAGLTEQLDGHGHTKQPSAAPL